MHGARTVGQVWKAEEQGSICHNAMHFCSHTHTESQGMGPLALRLRPYIC
jgi:hypothetical protein